MEKAYVYTLHTDERGHVVIWRKARSVKLMDPTKPLREQNQVTIGNTFKISDFFKVYKKLIWYQTDQTLILPDLDDEKAFQYFRGLLTKKERELQDQLIAAGKKIDFMIEDYSRGRLILEEK